MPTRTWTVRGRAWMRQRASARTGSRGPPPTRWRPRWALLSRRLDPEAFEIAFTAVPIASDDVPHEPIPVCRECGGLVGIFPDHGLRWQHFRGDGATSGAQQIYEPGHDPAVTWILPGEDPDDL